MYLFFIQSHSQFIRIYSCQLGSEKKFGRKRRIIAWESPSVDSVGRFPQIKKPIMAQRIFPPNG
jgi:hypothetical protein